MAALSVRQLERASEVAGNVAVAWFTAGVISPLFVGAKGWLELVALLTLSLLMAGAFFILSLALVGGSDVL